MDLKKIRTFGTWDCEDWDKPNSLVCECALDDGRVLILTARQGHKVTMTLEHRVEDEE